MMRMSRYSLHPVISPLSAFPLLSVPLQVPPSPKLVFSEHACQWVCASLFVPFVCGWVVVDGGVSPALSR